VQRKNRLSRSRDFDAVYRHGRSASTRFLTLHWFDRSRDDDAGEPRLGLAVPRAAGNAVVRNRIKRLVREVFRARREALNTALDIVVIAKPDAAQISHAQAATELERALGVAPRA